MRTPIALALSWPLRMPTPTEKLDLVKLGSLSFEAPDEVRFPALRVAREALQHGGSAPAVLNAANEVAVEAFLARRVGFTDIVRIVADCVEAAHARGLTGPATGLGDDISGRRGGARPGTFSASFPCVVAAPLQLVASARNAGREHKWTQLHPMRCKSWDRPPIGAI